MLHYIHYGKREHIEKFFEDGSIQIGTVRSYDTATHGPMIGDDQEGLSQEFITDQNIAAYLATGRPMPHDPFGLSIPMFGAPGVAGNIVQMINQSFNYAIFCVAQALHQQLCKNFHENYDAAIFIERPFPFFHEITAAFVNSGLVETVVFQHVADIIYRDRTIDVGTEIVEVFTKSLDYQHQGETRAIWNIGEPKDKFYRFRAPNAIRCCRKVLFEDMPNYAPGSLSPDELNKVMYKALKL